jgi:hypothetical protein
MTDYELSEHAAHIMRERGIHETWVKSTVEDPDRSQKQLDRTVHYLKAISQYGNRFLRVIVNPRTRPPKIVTAFFDRRVRR